MGPAEPFHDIVVIESCEVFDARSALLVEVHPHAAAAAVRDDAAAETGGLAQARDRNIDDHLGSKLCFRFGRTEESPIWVLVRKMSHELIM